MRWLALLLAAATALAALAQPAPGPAQPGHATVRVDGRALFRVAESGDAGARARARAIEQRLDAVLDSGAAQAPPVEVTEAAGGAGREILVGGRLVMLVTAADAQERGTTVGALAGQWAQVIHGALQRGIDRRLSPLDRFLAATQASVGTAFARVGESALSILPRAVAALLVIGVFWLLATGVRAVLRLLFTRFGRDRTVANLARQVGYYAVWLLGLAVAASAFGLEPQTVVTGLGLTSLALGFALKDVLSNFVCGLLILALRPFELGDQIVIGDTEGTVQRIELRATIVRTYDGRVVSVPNAETFTSRVTNNTAAPVRRAGVRLHLGYDADLGAAAQVLEAAAAAAAGVLPEPPPSVRLRELAREGAVMEVRFWTDSRRSDFVTTTSRVRLAAVEALRDAGIPLPEEKLELVDARAPLQPP